MSEADFRAATDQLGLPAEELGQALGVPAQSIRQMRADPNSTAFRNPPAGWQPVAARLARARALALLKLATALLREGQDEN
jgi:hypothetical protein